MIVVVSHHYTLPGMGDECIKWFHEIGVKMSRYPGFISRYNTQAVNDPTHVMAVYFWESEQALDGWDNGPDRRQSISGGPPILDPARPIYRTRFKILDEFKPTKAPTGTPSRR
jgi:heme-degrading monooxygenase HmoA